MKNKNTQKQDLSNTETLFNKLNTKRMEERESELRKIYGKRWDRYRINYARARDFEHEFDFPLYIMLEQTYRCNLACPTCVQGHENYRGMYEFDGRMPWDLYERIVLEGKEHGLPSISTHNNDEPLLVKDLGKRIKFARDNDVMDVIMTTNGLLFTEDRIKEIIDSGITRILFSIDAFTSETYDLVRPRRNKVKPGLSKVKWAIDKAINYRESHNLKLPIIRVAFVVSTMNQHEIYDFIKEWKDVVDYVDIQPLLLGGVIHHKDSLEPEIVGDRVEDFRCNSPWGRMVIRGNGDVIVCENFQGAATVTGNVYKNSIYDIYNSDFSRRLRMDGKDGEYKESACIECANNVYVADVKKYMKAPSSRKKSSWGLVNNLE